MSVYLRARSKLDLVSNQGCSFLPCVQDRKKKTEKKKIPLHYSFVIQCVKVFSRCGFRHNSVCVGVWWHGKTKQKKKNKTCYYFMQRFLCVFDVRVLEWNFSLWCQEMLVWVSSSATQVSWFGFFLSAVFVSSTGVVVHRQSWIYWTWTSPLWPRPRLPRWDFWPLSQKPDILPVYPVWFSSGGPADSWSPGSAVTSDGTAPEQQLARAFAPDVKGARNQHQICSVGPCAGGRGGPFN